MRLFPPQVKRQQRKLNFLITQTELYAHFMSKKLGQSTYEDQIRILSQLDEEKSSRIISNDDYDRLVSLYPKFAHISRRAPE